MAESDYLSAQEAAEALGITLPTLYSYVSRGLIHSEVADGRNRTRRYRRDDVLALKKRKEYRRNPTRAVEGALHWGTPVLESAITLIEENQLYYRGHNVLHLAVNHTVEQVAALIWADSLTAEVPGLIKNRARNLSKQLQEISHLMPDLPLVERFQALLPLVASEDFAAYDLRPLAVAQTGARILHSLVTIAAGEQPSSATIAHRLQQGWRKDEPQAVNLINSSLILCADHELNVSSFTARCVASAGATPYQVVLAGLAALQGVKHGRNTERVETFLNEAGTPAGVRAAMAGRLRRGEPTPGFGHPLYPQGDPRGQILLDLTTAAYPNSPAVALAQAMVSSGMDLMGERPTVDFSLVILAQTLRLPPSGSLVLFALGRTIGWIGQAIEQYQLDKIIRPRARYVGKAVDSG